MRALLILLLLASCACKPIDYLSDNTPSFMSSAEANSYEYPAKINGKICTLCATQFKLSQGMTIELPARPYGYELKIYCSRNIDFNKEFSVGENQSFKIKFSYEEIGNEELFICSGIINPRDRLSPIAAKFQVTANVVSERYDAREEIYRDKDLNVVFGERAFYSTCNGQTEKKLTVGPAKKCKGFVFSESEKMRFNYANY